MLKHLITQLKRSTRGAALVEYVVLFAILVIAIPGLAIYSGKVPDLYDGPFGIEHPDTATIEISVPGCVATGQCVAPPELIEWCREEVGLGVTCPDYNITIIPGPTGDLVVPSQQDPHIAWATSNRNEDYHPPVYSNSTVDGAGNTAVELVHPGYHHPAATYCAELGMFLPAIDQLAAMAPYMDALGLEDRDYLSSSQYWAAGSYNPPPVLEAFNYVSSFDFGRFERGENPRSHVFPTHAFPVRCVYGAAP